MELSKSVMLFVVMTSLLGVGLARSMDAMAKAPSNAMSSSDAMSPSNAMATDDMYSLHSMALDALGPNATAPDVDFSNKTILVVWVSGFNYAEWVVQNGPFHIDDTLVFQYDTHHSVYLMPDLESYNNCEVSKGKMVGSTTDGGGDGFPFKLEKNQTYYFVCGEHDGSHCNVGLMKFSITPIAIPTI